MSSLVNWLNYSDASRIAAAFPTQPAPQVISLMADTELLADSIPTQPKVITPESGPPSTIHQWYAMVGGRLISIECSAERTSNSAMIYTAYDGDQDLLGDWVSLLDLRPLSKSLYVSRPLYVESRNHNSHSVVFRPDPRGWKTAVYHAATSEEAGRFLTFLMEDSWNRTCYIDSPEPVGSWVTIQGDQAIAGYSPLLSDALRFACDLSQRYPAIAFIVKDDSKTHTQEYWVKYGRVINPHVSE